MCVVSAVTDHYTGKWPNQFPNVWPQINPNVHPSNPPFTGVSSKTKNDIAIETLQREVAELTKQVEELIDLMPVLKKYDEDNNEPDCEMDEKVELIRKLCDALGVDNNVL